MEKAEVLNAFFVPVFTSQTRLQEWHAPEARGRSKEDVTLLEEDQVRGYVNNLDIYKSMGPDGVHLELLREHDDVITKPLFIIFGRSWQLRDVSEDWRKTKTTSVFKKSQK